MLSDFLGPLRRLAFAALAALVALSAASIIGVAVLLADNTPQEQDYYAFTKDAVAPDPTLGHARTIAGYDSANNLLRWVRVNASGDLAVAAGSGGSGTNVTPQVPASVSCTDAGNINFTANALDARLSIINTSTTLDVCVRFGATSGADRTNLATCTFVIGRYGGSGTTDTYETPAGLQIGGQSFACDSNGTAVLAVVAWRRS